MKTLKLKPAAEDIPDLISLGEVLLRFDPGEQRIHNARSFSVWDGGAEYNVAKNLSQVFRQRTSIVSVLTDNALGRLAEDFVRQGGVDASELLWREPGGLDAETRNGLYFIERGFGLRDPDSCFDRDHTAISQLKSGDIDWPKIFAEKRARWFHTGGVFTGLSATTPEAAHEAMRIAAENGAIVSYDLNYRNSLWGKRGGRGAANALNRELLPLVDVAFGTFDFDSGLSRFDENTFRRAAEKMRADFPNLQIIASTLRETRSAGRHDLSAVCLAGEEIYKAADYQDIEVLDRVGSGDAFAAGFIYGFLREKGAQFAVECGAAHGALAMTTPGDTSMATLDEVLELMKGARPGAKR